MQTIHASSDFDLAKFHLDRFWHEIFWRRENEQKITVWTIGLFGALLALVYGRVTTLELLQKIVLSCFPAMLGFVACWYLHKNWVKGSEIARIIVQLNKAIGAWDKGILLQDSPLYPQKWENWGQESFTKDHVSFFYFLSVLGSAVFTVVGICLK
jgi:hypothetical protein